MKKILTLILVIVMGTMTFAIDSYIRVGAISGVASYNKEEKAFSHYAPVLGAEVTQGFLFADVGAGIAFNGKTGGSDIGTIPVYLVARITPIPIIFEPYLTLKYGTTLITDESVGNSNPEGKGYYGIGIGANFTSLQVEALYSNTKINGDNRGKDNLEQISLVFGYKLF